MKYNSSSELTISENSAQGDILLYSENKVKTAFVGIGTHSRLAGNFYFHMYVPVSFMVFYDMKNNYFKTDDSGSNYSAVVSSSGNVSIAYLLNHLKIEGGVDYSMYYSSLILDLVIKNIMNILNGNGSFIYNGIILCIISIFTLRNR